jgi:hypothetical protein
MAVATIAQALLVTSHGRLGTAIVEMCTARCAQPAQATAYVYVVHCPWLALSPACRGAGG